MRVNLLVWVILQNAAGELLLGRRDGSAYGHGLWGLPGGKVEDGEALAVAAAREVHEEVGVHVTALQLLGVRRYQVDDGARGVDFLFLTREYQGKPQPLHKTSEVGWFALGRLPPDLLPWLPAVLEAHLTGGILVSEQLGAPQLLSFGHKA